MKPTVFLLLLALPLAARAQILPVPGANNPDWQLETAAKKALVVPRSPAPADQMPTVAQTDPREVPNAMPNAFEQKLNRRAGSTYWDSQRRLRYEWQRTDSVVTVQEQATGRTYTYRRRALPDKPIFFGH